MKEFCDYYNKERYLIQEATVHPKDGQPAHRLVRLDCEGQVIFNQGKPVDVIKPDRYLEWNRYLWDQSKK